MNEERISRKKFLQNSALGVLGSIFIPNQLLANGVGDEVRILQKETMLDDKVKMNLEFKNVRLEVGFEYDGNYVVSTKTALFHVVISNGKIDKILPNNINSNAIDAKGLLMLPSFKDMHIHLDKTLYADKWMAVRRRGGVKEMIALEQKIIPEMLKNSTYKAEKLIELLLKNGSSFARNHVNIDPTSKLDSLKNLEIALENKKGSFKSETVAFPQHGLFYTNSLPYMKEAAKMNIDFIGGVDPYSLDGAIARTMDATVQLALDHGKGIDIHLHETGKTGIETILYLINKVNENSVLKGKTFVSHAFVLGQLPVKEQESMAEKLAAAKVGIISHVPIGKLEMPLPLLMNKGVSVMVGNDSIVDYWDTFGSGSVLQKANRAAELYGHVSEFKLSRMLKLATAGVLPLNDKGIQEWPKVGDDANFVFVDASCSAEAVSRISPIKSLVFKGNVVY